jgi:hypothetical protein
VKNLLYTERYTIDGARQKLEELKRSGAIKSAGRESLALDTVRRLETDLTDIIEVLAGRSSTQA